MTFGEKLRIARKNKKLTQKELASTIGAKHNSISNWENDQNKPDPDTIQSLCWILDVTPNYFFSNEISVLNQQNTDNHSENKHPLLQIYNNLNAEGQKNLMDYAEYIVNKPEYKKCDTLSEQEIS